MLHSISYSAEQRIQSVMSEGALSIKALSLPKGESMKKHHTPNVLYLQCLEGKPDITVYGASPEESDEVTTLLPNMLLRIEPNRPHAVDAGEEHALLLLHLLKPGE